MKRETIDGQQYIVERIGDTKVIHVGLEDLPFVDKLVMTDGTIIQNMKFERIAVPPIHEVKQQLESNNNLQYS
ncbi:hypothetical protein SAMN02745751_03170 [Dethiosulfatibacter aminovorans DSM 17477]|uniref:Uncharacterized protein n=1 Tax=Dethiosulfatibacter aminovorans DSM 17477 TaxID=1121476 RepID=A0A1M6LGZ9_9FIRM|nr:hypothetical protein [Dethiosulfatibacter aminovorans]SHJ70437.1 hypothetical protein SAMN02745751_03170 [Dethiosulfatibacter aminovorans DSM 17477]